METDRAVAAELRRHSAGRQSDHHGHNADNDYWNDRDHYRNDDYWNDGNDDYWNDDYNHTGTLQRELHLDMVLGWRFFDVGRRVIQLRNDAVRLRLLHPADIHRRVHRTDSDSCLQYDVDHNPDDYDVDNYHDGHNYYHNDDHHPHNDDHNYYRDHYHNIVAVYRNLPVCLDRFRMDAGLGVPRVLRDLLLSVGGWYLHRRNLRGSVLRRNDNNRDDYANNDTDDNYVRDDYNYDNHDHAGTVLWDVYVDVE